MANADYDLSNANATTGRIASGGLANTLVRPESGLNEEAQSARNETAQLHGQLDDLELRLFGPEPRGVEAGEQTNSSVPPAVLAVTLRATRQRLESANSRLSRILARL